MLQQGPKISSKGLKGPKSLGGGPKEGPERPQNIDVATNNFRRAPECQSSAGRGSRNKL